MKKKKVPDLILGMLYLALGCMHGCSSACRWIHSVDVAKSVSHRYSHRLPAVGFFLMNFKNVKFFLAYVNPGDQVLTGSQKKSANFVQLFGQLQLTYVYIQAETFIITIIFLSNNLPGG